MYLTKIKIQEDFRNLKKDTEIELKTLTYLVGEQGCGKSSLLSLLQKNDINYELSDFGKSAGSVQSFYFDSEKMNPRIQDMDDFTNLDGTDRGIGVAGGLMSKFQSHGEVLKEYTVNRIKDADDCVLLLDEPEAALSLRNQYKLTKELIKATSKRKVQIIAATHCLALIESVDMVFNMEIMEWVSSKEFIKQSKI